MAQWNPALTPVEALKILMEGNANFAAGRTVRAQIGMCERRKKELLSGQNPLAIILCCSDSRIAPQYVFDREIGELFVIRVAGNVVDSVVIGSIEYALEQFGTPIIMVLGHQNCGAVQAAATHAEHVSGSGFPCAAGSPHITAILEKIAPSIE
ncbi:MAG: carbonic anhydrase, partial [Thermodesulfobacteriota bacterium]